MRPLLLLTVVPLLLSPPPAGADDAPDGKDPYAVLRRAIGAHGGADRLSRSRQHREVTRGTLLVSGAKVPFTSDSVVRLPGQFRNVTETTLLGRKHKVIQVFDGDKGWVNDKGVSQAADAATLGGWKELAHAGHLALLTPLLARDKGYDLTALGASEVGGRKALGVKVALKGRRDVRLYFAGETGLLVKMSYQPLAGGKAAVRDEVYSAFKDFDGLKRHTRTVVHLGGVAHAEVELISFKVLDRVDDKQFTRP